MTIQRYILENVFTDEIFMDTGGTVVLCEIISCVLGHQVSDSITTCSTICKNCLKTLISCYKFIQLCKNNIKKLNCKLNSFQKHIESVMEVNCDYKSIFIALNDGNSSSELYYDKHRHSNDQMMLRKRFERIKKDSLNFFIEFEEEPSYDKLKVKTKKHNTALQSINLTDIAVDANDLNNIKCKACLKLHPSALKLKMHYLSVHGPKDYKCSECPKEFTLLSRLNQHKQSCHHNVMCSQCGKTFNNYFTLRYHEQSHKLKLICETCGKTYKSKLGFNNHIKHKLCNVKRKLNSESKFICDYCKKRYASKCTLRKHISVEHENGKSFSCSWCGKKFGCESSLSSHIIKHTKKKDFVCDICKKKFVSKVSLLYHRRRHIGEKPYKCEHCDKTFVAPYLRTQHEHSCHSEPGLECDICHSRFKSKLGLHKHTLRHSCVRSKVYKNCSLPLLHST
ncbi:zinc finger protein 91-like isoform X2 [Spodoptera litura]|uniref:Zinc finger protein 91-like isoform X2 n=1 Tax=Spodoptera litura TaxID=69820 RepID=A0A9J7EIA8_SPOLT|nr:zinc finger protein 91-like isoform X2 [Spodoptera litura]